jgi:hypothetical protein
MPGARAAQTNACREKGLLLIFEAPTCHDAVTALEWLVMTDPDCKGAGLEGGVVGPEDCRDGGSE